MAKLSASFSDVNAEILTIFMEPAPPVVETIPDDFSSTVPRDFSKRSKRLIASKEPDFHLWSSLAEVTYKENTYHNKMYAETSPLPEMESGRGSVNMTPSPPLFSETPLNTVENFIEKENRISISKKAVRSLPSKFIDDGVYLKRSKRSPYKPRSSSSVNNKRFGQSVTSPNRVTSTGNFRRNARTSAAPSKSHYSGFNSRQNQYSATKARGRESSPSKGISNTPIKRQPVRSTKDNFRGRSIKAATTTSQASASSASTRTLPTLPTRNRGSVRFGQKNNDDKKNSDISESDFEASEAVLRSMTQRRFPSETTTVRSSSNRLSKLPRFKQRLPISPSRTTNQALPSSTRSSNRRPTKATNPARRPSRNKAANSRRPKESTQVIPTEIAATPTSSTKRRFTLTTSVPWVPKIEPTKSSYLASQDTEDINRVQEDHNRAPKRKGKQRSSTSPGRYIKEPMRRGRTSQSSYNTNENELESGVANRLQLSPFARGREVKRPPPFDPRTIKAATSTSTNSIITLNNPETDIDQTFEVIDTDKPITVTAVVTNVKTLPVHLGLRTSFATITTTGFSTSTVHPRDLTTITRGGETKLLLSSIVGLPDAELPPDKQFTMVTEIILTTTEIESTSLVAIKVGFGTRTDTVLAKQILTTLTTQVNTIVEKATAPPAPFNPYFQNPYAPMAPVHNPDYSFSISENSFVSTETVTSTTVLPLYLNGRSILTTLTSTSVTESTVVKTTTVKVPQMAPNPFIFQQPVFILPSITTELTLYFTAGRQIFSTVTRITVAVMPAHGISRFARSIPENPDETQDSPFATQHIGNIDDLSSFEISQPFQTCISASNDSPCLQSSFNLPHSHEQSMSQHSSETQNLDFGHASEHLTESQGTKNVPSGVNDLEGSHTVPSLPPTNTGDIEDLKEVDNYSFKKRKLLQLNFYSDSPPDENSSKITLNTPSLAASTFDDFNFYNLTNFDALLMNDSVFSFGLVYNNEGLPRPIPSVRVIPTRRAYIRKIRPDIPAELDSGGFGYRQNVPNFAHQGRNVFPHTSEQARFVNRYNRPEEFGNQVQVIREQNVSPSREIPSPPSQQRRVIRLRRPGFSGPQAVSRDHLERNPTVNNFRNNGYPRINGNGPLVANSFASVPNVRDPDESYEYQNEDTKVDDTPLSVSDTITAPLTYYTTFTYMTTFYNGPSTAYSTREAVVSNVATETLNPDVVELIRSKGGFTTPYGFQTAVPLGSRSLGATTTVVNLASRIQLFNSDIYYGKLGAPHSEQVYNSDRDSPEVTKVEESVPQTNYDTLSLTDVATLPKTYFTLFTYYYTVYDGDDVNYSQRSETISNVVTETDPFLKHTFSNTIDANGDVTLQPETETINLGSRAVDGGTTEVNLELRTVVHFDNLRNVVLDTYGVTPPAADIQPTETEYFNNNYLEPSDPDAQDQNTYQHTVPIQPSFTSGTQQYTGQSHSVAVESTPEIPSDIQLSRTRPLRGPTRIASTRVQRPGTLESKVFIPRPGVRVRVRPVSTRLNRPRTESDVTTPELPTDQGYTTENDESDVLSGTQNPLIENQSNGRSPKIEATRPNESDEDDSSEDDGASEEEPEEEISRETPTPPTPGRKRLKVTVRRPVGSSVVRNRSRFVLPSSTRPRFFVVTRSGYSGSLRPTNKPVSVKVSRRPKPSDVQPSSNVVFDTYTTVTSVPVIFGLSTTYRTVVVTSSSERPQPIVPSKTVVVTYFTTTTYTVPYTVADHTTYTTVEETNSRILTETIVGDAEVPVTASTPSPGFVDETVSFYLPGDEPKISSSTPSPSFGRPQVLENSAQFGGRLNLVTKVSNGVSLIMASGSESDSPYIETKPTKPLSLSPTMVSDFILMKNKDITTVLEPKTFYTTFTFFTTFFSGGVPTISTSESVVTNVYTVPVTRSIENDIIPTIQTPLTVVETTEQLISATLFKTHTFFATLFNGTQSFVTPLEEIKSEIVTSTETYTITRTVTPVASVNSPLETIHPAESREIVPTTVTTVYRTQTNFVTLFTGTESVVSPMEETFTDVLTINVIPNEEASQANEVPQAVNLFTTRTIEDTRTHYITLFSSGQPVLSSITEVVPSIVTELVRGTDTPTIDITTTETSSVTPILETETFEILPSSSSKEEQSGPAYQDLIPSIKTQYTTLTYFTTLFKDASTILSSREEIATSYITLFVPVSSSDTIQPTTQEQTLSTEPIQIETIYSPPAEKIQSSPAPGSAVLTFYTTYTYYTTLFRGTETIISDSETVVTQYVTIETTPTEQTHQDATIKPVVTKPHLTESVTSRLPSSGYGSEGTDSNAATPEENKEEETVSFKGDSDGSQASILTGTPTTDSNGSTLILFTDFVIPSSFPVSYATSSPSYGFSSSTSSVSKTPALPVNVIKSLDKIEPTPIKLFGRLTPNPSLNRPSATEPKTHSSSRDDATTRVTDADVATHHQQLVPTSTYSSSSTGTLGIKPGAVIDLSDVLGNTNLVGNLGETIKGIVNLFAAAGNRGKNSSSSQESSFTSVHPSSQRDETQVLPSGGVTVSSAEEPIYIPIGAIGKSSETIQPGVFISKPSTLLTGFTPLVENADGTLKPSKPESETEHHETIIFFNTDTLFLQPTPASDIRFRAQSHKTKTSNRTATSLDNESVFSKGQDDTEKKTSTSDISSPGGIQVITGVETIMFGLPEARHPEKPSTVILGSGELGTTSIVGVETIFFDDTRGDPQRSDNTEDHKITGATTIFSSFPILFPSRSTATESSTSFVRTSTGDTTIFFPIAETDHHQLSAPATRYVTSVESMTLTLTLTTSVVDQTNGSPVTMTSVFTTTIPPRTYVTTIIGSRTILGTLPEPTETVQIESTMRQSESTTTVTTTTLIFNSIATTVVRTLVIPTQAPQPTGTSPGTEATISTGQDSENRATDQSNDKNITPKAPLGRKPVQLFRAPTRPTEATTPKQANVRPMLKLFPTKPPTTTTPNPPPRTTRKTNLRKPGKALIPITDGCTTECSLKNKEVCKQSEDKSWSCQCRTGFFRKAPSEECKDVKSYTVLVRVFKMDGKDVSYGELNNSLSSEYKNFAVTARKAVDDAYKTSNVKDDYVSANILRISDSGQPKEGVLVNLTVHVSGKNAANEDLLKEELIQSLDAAASEIDLLNATLVSPIIQRVEDVQDFDECADSTFNDCSRSSVCVNLPGSYTCTCKEGYQDLEPLLPGRICSGEIKDCDFCNNRGVCIMTEDDNKFCRCYRMYLGKQCEINGLVLAISLPIALALLILTMFCLLCGCRRLRRRHSQKVKATNVYKGMAPPLPGTLDRKAMIMDSSSESSGEHGGRHANLAYDDFGDELNSTMKRSRRSSSFDDHLSSEFQVPTVLIPRARHHHPKQVNVPSHRVA